MARQSISFTPLNDEWLKSQVDSQEFSSKSEVVNALIREAREITGLRDRLIAAEKSGFSSQTRGQMLRDFELKARRDGKL